MSAPRNASARLKHELAEAKALAEELGEFADPSGRKERAEQIYLASEGEPLDLVRRKAAIWQAYAEALRDQFHPMTMRLAEGLAPMADVGRITLESDIKQGQTRRSGVGARYADAAAVVARRLFSEQPHASWEDLCTILHNDLAFETRLPGNDAIRKQMTKRGIRPASGTTA